MSLPDYLAVELNAREPGECGGYGCLGATYQASQFPLPFRLTAPDASWAGAQWKSARQHVAPFYGWAAVAQGGTNPKIPPHGWIAIMTSYSATLSVAATVDSLRSRGHGATYPAANALV